MRTLMAVMIAATAAWTGGCNSPEWPTQRRNEMNAWAIEQYNRDSVRAGIIRQHTIYPYHFVADSAELNELGMRDVGVLADHYRDHPGTVIVRQLGAHQELYDARLAMVGNTLAEQGVATDRMRIGDGQAGGEGLSSERTLYILDERFYEKLELEDVGLTTIEGTEDN